MPKKPTAKKTAPLPTDDIPDDEPTVTPEPSHTIETPAVSKPTIVKSSPMKAARRRSLGWVWWTASGVIVAAAVIALGWKLFGTPTTTTTTNKKATTDSVNTDTLVPRAIDGVPVKAEAANTPIQAVMIENQIDARPQSALDKASVVYEALAEGGITRFMGMFPVGGERLDQIGPVRSARTYYVNWAEEYKALYAHAGGSPEALIYLSSGKANVVDFNQFAHGGNFIRDAGRAAPHNLYTSSDLLYNGLRNTTLRNYTPNYKPWSFKDEAPLDNRPATTNDIVINFSSFNYKVAYKYDRVQNRYQRYQADKPHLMRDGSSIYAKDIVVLFEPTVVTQNNHGRLDITTTGTGKLLMFRDGTATQGTWRKDSKAQRTQFLDASGNDLALNPGQIWVEVVPTDRTVTY